MPTIELPQEVAEAIAPMVAEHKRKHEKETFDRRATAAKALRLAEKARETDTARTAKILADCERTWNAMVADTKTYDQEVLQLAYREHHNTVFRTGRMVEEPTLFLINTCSPQIAQAISAINATQIEFLHTDGGEGMFGRLAPYHSNKAAREAHFAGRGIAIEALTALKLEPLTEEEVTARIAAIVGAIPDWRTMSSV
jgi:hypothetical protein